MALASRMILVASSVRDELVVADGKSKLPD